MVRSHFGGWAGGERFISRFCVGRWEIAAPFRLGWMLMVWARAALTECAGSGKVGVHL